MSIAPGEFEHAEGVREIQPRVERSGTLGLLHENTRL
jgi:hypothetical protein